jgi:fluoroacetyl-CoA thioesterase
MRVGDVGEATLVVGPGDTARAVATSAEDEFPDVPATTRMIALMEVAAARAMRGLLRKGQLAVGVGVDVRHLAATPVGVEARAAAAFLGMEDKLHRFKVQAFDPAGLVGEGEHTKAIIDRERLLSGAKARSDGR